MHETNRLIEALSLAAREQVLAVARTLTLPQNFVLSHSSESVHDVYFLTRGVASFVVALQGGESSEIGMLGNEGMVGSTSLLGSYAPVANCIMQMPGAGLRVPAADMKRLFDESAEIRGLILQSTQQQMLSISQIAACNRLHDATQRLARWLLTAADRAGTDIINLTQEAMAQMLGTRRTTVALVAGALQRNGLISYQRGNVQIVDRPGLTAAACDCYRITKQMVDRLYTAPAAKV